MQPRSAGRTYDAPPRRVLASAQALPCASSTSISSPSYRDWCVPAAATSLRSLRRMNRAASPTRTRIATAGASGVETVTSTGRASEASTSRSIVVRIVAAVDAVACSGSFPVALLVGRPVCRVSTSTTRGRPSAAERSKNAAPTTSVSHVARNSTVRAVNFTPPGAATMCRSGILVGAAPSTICRRRACCAGDPPTILVDDPASAAGIKTASAAPTASAASSRRPTTLSLEPQHGRSPRT